jgi:hypothetical protein
MMYKRITAPQLPLESQTGCFALWNKVTRKYTDFASYFHCLRVICEVSNPHFVGQPPHRESDTYANLGGQI